MLVIDDWESSIEGLKDWAVFELFEGFFFPPCEGAGDNRNG